jgi:predicted N-acetyltransferase YhbS
MTELYSHITIRSIQKMDAEACGRIGYEAHRAVAAEHGYPPEQPSVEFATGLIEMKLNDPNAWGGVAESEGRVIGSIFVNTFPPAPVAVIGPLTVNPSKGGRAGHELMAAALGEAKRRAFDQVRLVQSPSHFRSLALYSKMGFDVREPLVLMQGKPIGKIPNAGNRRVREAGAKDLAECNELSVSVYGFARDFELQHAIQQGIATVVERGGAIVGYATGIGFLGHAISKTTEDLLDLINFAPAFLGPGFFVPIRNGGLLRSLFTAGLRSVWPANLMTLGQYKEPSGAFLPSIAF